MLPGYLWSQYEAKIDSLHTAISIAMYSNPEHTEKMIQEAMLLSEDSKDELWVAYTLLFFSKYNDEIIGDYETSLTALKKADSIFREFGGAKDIKALGAIEHNYGAYDHRHGNYAGAIEHYLNAIAILDTVSNKIVITLSYNNVAELYSSLKDYAKAEKYARECLKLA